MKKIFLTLLCLLALAGNGWGAVFHAKSTGTKESGASTADDWTDANCYATIQAAINNLATDGDSVILDDVEWSMTTNLTTINMACSADGSFTIESRSGNRANCIIKQTVADKVVIGFNEATYTYNFTLKNLTLTNSAPNITIPGAAAWLLQKTGDVTFNNVLIDGFDFNFGATESVTGALIRCGSITAEGVTRTLSLTNGTKIDNINIDASNHTGMVGTDVDTKLIIDTADIGSLRIAVDDNSNAYGGFYCRNDVTISDLTISGPVYLISPDAGTGANSPIINSHSTSATMTIDGITAVGTSSQNVITQTGGAISGILIKAYGPYTVDNLILTYASSSEAVTNGLGGAMVAYGESATGTYSDAEVSYVNCTGGCGFYASQGGSGTVNRLYAHHNTATARDGIEPGPGPGVQGGGWGDLTVRYSRFEHNIADTGGPICSYLHEDGTRDKTTTIENCTFLNNTTTGDDSGDTASSSILARVGAAYTHTVNVSNNICDNASSTGEIKIIENAGTAVLNLDSNYVRGGADAVTGETTYTNAKTSYPIAGATIAGIHDQETAAVDLAGNDILILPPMIGAYENRTSLTVATDDYAPTGYTIRHGATLIYNGDGHLDLSGLTDTEAITVKLKSDGLNQFTPNGATTVMEPVRRPLGQMMKL